jgi:hypothetical protein
MTKAQKTVECKSKAIKSTLIWVFRLVQFKIAKDAIVMPDSTVTMPTNALLK